MHARDMQEDFDEGIIINLYCIYSTERHGTCLFFFLYFAGDFGATLLSSIRLRSFDGGAYSFYYPIELSSIHPSLSVEAPYQTYCKPYRV